jgi:hypothetical protein
MRKRVLRVNALEYVFNELLSITHPYDDLRKCIQQLFDIVQEIKPYF